MADQVEASAMRRALVAAAEHGPIRGPNPRVGCVILAPDGSELAIGVHLGVGTPHAEMAALAQVGDARGATAVVTLEPCNHHGRTGPCTDALLEAGISRVVFGQTDPNPTAAGGAARLSQAGVDIEGGLFADECAALNKYWAFAVANRRPFVTWKFAASLDGRSAAADGSSRWITSTEARADVHGLRGLVDAIAVGTGTVLADDPELTARDSNGEMLPGQPLRVVIGRRSLPPDARVLTGVGAVQVYGSRDLVSVLGDLGDREIRHLMLEGGPRLAGAFLRLGLVDEVVAYISPILLGGGSPALVDAGITSINQALRLQILDVTGVGPDLRITGRPQFAQEA